MLEMFFEKRFVLERFRASPVGAHIDGFAASLTAQGYSFVAGSQRLVARTEPVNEFETPESISLVALSPRGSARPGRRAERDPAAARCGPRARRRGWVTPPSGRPASRCGPPWSQRRSAC